MKVFIVILALILLIVNCTAHPSHDSSHGYVVKTHDDLVKFRSECSTTLNVPNELVEKYKKWEYPDDHVTHCYMKCMFEKFGFFDEHLGFDVQKIHHQLVGDHNDPIDHNDETHKKIENCADKNTEGSDACTWAYRGGMCFIKNNLHLVKHSVAATH